MNTQKSLSVFFDTEFAGDTTKRESKRFLISIGLVAHDGREFYAELTDTWTEQQCSSFVLETVLPLLDGGDCRMGVQELATRLKVWIESLSEGQVILRTDAPQFDFPFVEEIFNSHGWPTNLRKTCGSIRFESSRQNHRYESGVADFFKTHGKRQHHALVDARSMQFGWKYAIKRGI